MIPDCTSIPGVMIPLCKMLHADFLAALIGVWRDGCASRTRVAGDAAEGEPNFPRYKRPKAGTKSYGSRERRDGSGNLSPSKSAPVTTIPGNTFDQPQSSGPHPLSEAERLPRSSVIAPRSSTQLINAMIDKWRLLLERRRSVAVSCRTRC